MKRSKRALYWVIFCGLLFFFTPGSRVLPVQGGAELPADLLFTSTKSGDYGFWPQTPRNVIVRVDAFTLETTPFYVDEEASYVIPLSWSPQGDLLAFYRLVSQEDDYIRQVCLLSRKGVLLRCFDATPPSRTGYPRFDTERYMVTWSADGRRAYFVTECDELERVPHQRCLIEADTTTGQTLRVLYTLEYPTPTPFVWTSQRDMLLIGAGDEWVWQAGAPPQLVDLASRSVLLDLSTVVPPNATPDRVSPYLSPQGTYVEVFVHYDLTTYNPWQIDQNVYGPTLSIMLIVDRQGKIRATFGRPEDTLPVPLALGWSGDERTLYTVTRDLSTTCGEYALWHPLRFHAYDLGTAQAVSLNADEPCRIQRVKGPLSLSPNDTSLVFLSLPADTDPYSKAWQVTVLPMEAGTLQIVGAMYRFGVHPLWMPPTLGAGTQARVHVLSGDTLSVRAGPGLDFAVQERLEDGALVDVLEGPERADGYVWWRVRTPSGVEGWAVQTADGVRTLQVVQ